MLQIYIALHTVRYIYICLALNMQSLMSVELNDKKIGSLEEKENVPELRVSLQLQHRGVCVPLQRPDVINTKGKRGHACLQIH